MTYKDFEKKLKELDEGLEVRREVSWIEVRCAGEGLLHIDSKYPYQIDTMLAGFNNIVENKPYAGELFDLCVELAKTPIDERIEQQRYYVEFTDGHMLRRGCITTINIIGIVRPSDSFPENDGKPFYTFTEAQIKAIDPRYWAFAVPVEEEEN